MEFTEVVYLRLGVFFHSGNNDAFLDIIEACVKEAQ